MKEFGRGLSRAIVPIFSTNDRFLEKGCLLQRLYRGRRYAWLESRQTRPASRTKEIERCNFCFVNGKVEVPFRKKDSFYGRNFYRRKNACRQSCVKAITTTSNFVERIDYYPYPRLDLFTFIRTGLFDEQTIIDEIMTTSVEIKRRIVPPKVNSYVYTHAHTRSRNTKGEDRTFSSSAQTRSHILFSNMSPVLIPFASTAMDHEPDGTRRNVSGSRRYFFLSYPFTAGVQLRHACYLHLAGLSTPLPP